MCCIHRDSTQDLFEDPGNAQVGGNTSQQSLLQIYKTVAKKMINIETTVLLGWPVGWLVVVSLEGVEPAKRLATSF